MDYGKAVAGRCDVTGYVVITSSDPNCGGSAGVLPIQVFKRSEFVDFIIKGIQQDGREDADELDHAPGDLALEQAAAHMEERAESLTDYLKLFRERRAEVLERGKPTAYPKTKLVRSNLDLLERKE